eukprot:2036361-Pyramimonas_sp.AAC.1
MAAASRAAVSWSRHDPRTAILRHFSRWPSIHAQSSPRPPLVRRCRRSSSPGATRYQPPSQRQLGSEVDPM